MRWEAVRNKHIDLLVKIVYTGKSLRRLKRVETTCQSSHSNDFMIVFCTYEVPIML